LDATGKVIRTYTNKPDAKFQTFPGGPTADPVLNAAPGLNRFVWNLRHATLSGVPTVFIEGSYAGRKAVPGAYSVRVKALGQEKTVPFVILPDPRLKATAADYEQQDKMAAAVEAGVNDIHHSVLRMRQIKKQVTDLMALLENKPALKPLLDNGKALVKRMDTWEAELVQNKAQANDDVINFANKLSADYIFLKGELDSNVPYVRQAHHNRLNELNTVWQKHKAEMDAILKGVEAFNQQCRQMNVQNIIVPMVP
jgi:hypothetical protein